MSQPEDPVSADAIRRSVGENPVWYHTIELAPGIATPGQVDMRSVAASVLPDDLNGKRVLDVGTFDGFWAFEMEKRGAEVVAVDVEKIDDAEWPPRRRDALRVEVEAAGVELGRGFRIASAALRSQVDRRVCNFYDLTPERLGGPVDLVFAGTILLHLRDPVRALEAARSVLSEGGEMRLLEPFSAALTLRSPRQPAAEFQTMTTPFNWWVPNLAALRSWLVTAGFESVERLAFVKPPSVEAMRQRYVVMRALPSLPG